MCVCVGGVFVVVVVGDVVGVCWCGLCLFMVMRALVHRIDDIL